MKRYLFVSCVAITLLATSCDKGHGDNSVQKPNILLIIADDMGLDACPGYAVGVTKPNMPNLQKWMSEGLTFNNFWTYPVCTPTRGSILTGKYGFRTKVQKVDDVLSPSEPSLHAEMKSLGYATGQFGKWHLSRDAGQPNAMGIDFYAGILTGAVNSYYNWNMSINGATENVSEYTTTKLTDLAIDWISQQTDPWFAWMAYNAPHTPFHRPPDSLHSQGNLPDEQASIDANPMPYYMAALEALDAEMGRLYHSLSEEDKANTLIIFIGDNGTPGQVVQEYNTRRAKGSIYQGGINCPLIVSGVDVTRMGEKEDALVSTVDLFSTILASTRKTDTDANDSRSFQHLFSGGIGENRDYIFTENGTATDSAEFAIRNETHKYILFTDGTESLFDLSDNPFERPNLLSPNQAPLSETDSLQWLRLKEAMNAILD